MEHKLYQELSYSDTLPYILVTNIRVTALQLEDQLDLMMRWANAHESRTVCVANVHMLVEANRNPEFYAVLDQADLVTPDGMPLVWMMRLLGNHAQNRVAGLDIIDGLCHLSLRDKVKIFLLGSDQETLDRMQVRFRQEFPGLMIAGAEPLPFRSTTEAEEAAIAMRIKNSGAGIIFVSLGCPKQERWITKQRGKIGAVMIGLGGAFPVYAGLQKRAPNWIRNACLEWLYRLIQEPRRLWWRYITTIPLFILLVLNQLVKQLRV